MEEINIYEFIYNSKNKLHYWKKSEVALYLVGNFAEDISMYRQRNREYNLKGLIEQILKIDFNQAMMKGYLKGRTLWCASQLAEIVPKDFQELNMGFFQLAISILIEENANPNLCPLSVKLVATRCINKYSRKLKKEIQVFEQQQFEKILNQITFLLDNTSFESIYVPIEALTQYSKLNEDLVAHMAPKVTPKLLKLFRNYHNEGQLGQELLNLFKIWTHYDKCRNIFVNTFIPFIIEIIDNYYNSSANVDNKDQMLIP